MALAVQRYLKKNREKKYIKFAIYQEIILSSFTRLKKLLKRTIPFFPVDLRPGRTTPVVITRGDVLSFIYRSSGDQKSAPCCCNHT